uniref:non-specific serine/threonine protein kinase n=2 Tax=Aegilops tauschii subsp. strangulata TaxID=200361 RepID=A0A453T3H7_AEGTS
LSSPGTTRRPHSPASCSYQSAFAKEEKSYQDAHSPLFPCINHCRRLAAFFSPPAVSRKNNSMDYASSETTVMPLDLLREITNDFSEERRIGSGSYGKVYLGVHQHGKRIAVKILYDMPGIDDEQFQNEFNNLTRLRHQNIVRLVGYCHNIQEIQVEYKGKLVLAEKTHRALCLEYMSNGSLDKYLSDECDRYDWQTGYGIIKGICQGLKYLHNELKPPIYHLDLKPANVLLDENMVPRIADFGMSRLFRDEKTRATNSSLGTIGYLPPEYICNNLISNKFDIFSLGVVIIKIMAGRAGYFNSANMSSQEFSNVVRERVIFIEIICTYFISNTSVILIYYHFSVL